jgi:uncharacterized membrane protein
VSRLRLPLGRAALHATLGVPLSAPAAQSAAPPAPRPHVGPTTGADVAAPPRRRPAYAPAPRAPRAEAIDVLRGLVMVVMTVDHAREYAAGPGRVGDPMDLAAVTPLLFWLRWLAHFCAPVFVLLAGVSARLQGQRLGGAELSRHLAVRGLVLVALEFTLVDWGWTFNPAWPLKFAQVIWGIGVSLLALAALVRLPARAVAAIGVAIVAGHNLLDGVVVTGGGQLRYLWAILHHREVLPLGGGFSVRTSYPVLPLIGLAAAGFGLGGWFGPAVAPARRRRVLAALGGGAIALFVALRLTNGYGDPHDAVRYPDAASTVMSLLNVTKYPISLGFALMALGPALLLLAAWDRAVPRRTRPVALLGRVPMFYYVAHLWALHVAALVAAVAAGHPLAAFDVRTRFGGIPAGFGFPLWASVPFALAVAALLYPACAWYDRLRASRRVAWTRYV